jgi:hypothetical protein
VKLLLLDASFPLALFRRLRGAGKDVEQLVAPGDDDLRRRLGAEAVVFLTQDQELADIAADFRSQIVISGLPPWMPIGQRVDTWLAAIDKLAEPEPGERLFEILPWGELIAWEIVEFGRRLRGPVGR